MKGAGGFHEGNFFLVLLGNPDAVESNFAASVQHIFTSEMRNRSFFALYLHE